MGAKRTTTTPSVEHPKTVDTVEVHRRREALLLSLDNPHPETTLFADIGFDNWAAGLPTEVADLVDPTAGTAVRWIEGKGWIEVP